MQTPQRKPNLQKRPQTQLRIDTETSILEENKDEAKQSVKRTTMKAAAAKTLSKTASVAVLPRKMIERPSTARPPTTPGAAKRGPVLTQNKTRAQTTKRPTTARPATTKSSTTSKQLIPAKPAAKVAVKFQRLQIEGFEDPIAQALHAREKIAGNILSDLKEADAKKQGVQLAKPIKLAALKGPLLVDFNAVPSEKSQPESNLKTTKTVQTPKAGLSKSMIEDKSKAAPTPKNQSKKVGVIPPKTPTAAQKAGVQTAAAKIQMSNPVFNGDLSSDPIGESLRDRLQNGGILMSISETDAKKIKLKVPKAFKILAKTLNQEFINDSQPNEESKQAVIIQKQPLMPKTPKGAKPINKEVNLAKAGDSKEVKKVKRAPVVADVPAGKIATNKVAPGKPKPKPTIEIHETDQETEQQKIQPSESKPDFKSNETQQNLNTLKTPEKSKPKASPRSALQPKASPKSSIKVEKKDDSPVLSPSPKSSIKVEKKDDSPVLSPAKENSQTILVDNLPQKIENDEQEEFGDTNLIQKEIEATQIETIESKIDDFQKADIDLQNTDTQEKIEIVPPVEEVLVEIETNVTITETKENEEKSTENLQSPIELIVQTPEMAQTTLDITEKQNSAQEQDLLNKTKPKQLDIDLSVLKNIWPFLRPRELIPDDQKLKDFQLIETLHQELVQKIANNYEQLAHCLQISPSCASDTAQQFKLKTETINSLQLIEEEPLDFSDWVENVSSNEWVARVLKLFLFSQKNFAIINKWCRWPEVFHTSDEMFFLKASQAIEDDVDSFDSYLVKKAEEMQLEQISGEQIARVQCLVDHVGGIQSCEPHCEQSDKQICHFIMYVMRDAIEYLGLRNQEGSEVHIYKLCSYKQKYFNEVETLLRKKLAVYQ